MSDLEKCALCGSEAVTSTDPHYVVCSKGRLCQNCLDTCADKFHWNDRQRLIRAEARIKELEASETYWKDKYQCVVKAIGDVCDGGQYRNDTIESIECMKKRIKELESKLRLAGEALNEIGPWLSAALDDPAVCKEMKNACNSVMDAIAKIGEKGE